jgi:hypothetical protein
VLVIKHVDLARDTEHHPLRVVLRKSQSATTNWASGETPMKRSITTALTATIACAALTPAIAQMNSMAPATGTQKMDTMSKTEMHKTSTTHTTTTKPMAVVRHKTPRHHVAHRTVHHTTVKATSTTTDAK